MTENKGDLISREALKKAIEEYRSLNCVCTSTVIGVRNVVYLIDNAPTVLFPLTVKIKDNVTDEDKETLKRLMEDYKPQVLNLETERPNGEERRCENCKHHYENDCGTGAMPCAECKHVATDYYEPKSEE